VIVVARSAEKENARIGTENQSRSQVYTAFKIIPAEPPNAKAGMKML
jgi:hypothetical protein